MDFWTLLEYNNDDNHDAESIGVFSSKILACDKLLTIIKKEYEKSSRDNLFELNEEWFGDEEDIERPWEDYEKVIRKKLNVNKKCNAECNGLDYLNYKITKHQIDE